MFNKLCIAVLAISLTLTALTANAQRQLGIEIDGNKKLQRIDGIGVNANTRSWNDKELIPAIDLLVDSMKANIWRVIAETSDAWEITNDNADPFSFNWNYYDSLYETPKFRKAWEMIAYLNDKGISDNLMINFMGFAPSWMGNKVIEPQHEDEYVEMIVSFFYYALKKKHLKFGLIAPTNESDHHKYSEGPHLSGVQHARIIRKTIERMDNLGISASIKIVAPDNADKNKSFDEFLPAMMNDSLVMSRTEHLAFHSYLGNGSDIQPFIDKTHYASKSFWITEWNTWCNGCDDGILGDYNYEFARKSVHNLLKLLRSGAGSCLLWEGYDSYYSHHAPSKFSYWGALAFDSTSLAYIPRKHFYAIQQVSRFVRPMSRQLSITKSIDSVEALAFIDSAHLQLTIAGINNSKQSLAINANVKNLSSIWHADMYYTDEHNNLKRTPVTNSNDNTIGTEVPPDCIFTVVMKLKPTALARPEPKDWLAGDIHVHRNCGDDVLQSDSAMAKMMDINDLSVMSLLADMGNAEVKDSKTDLRKVDGKSILVANNRLLHWDTEWHWDATYSQFGHQALGGHLILLGLKNAKQIWEKSPYKILDWAKQQNAVKGFAHFQYLNDSVQKELNCCIPIDYPVEAALGTIDFISEDVFSSNMKGGGSFNSEAALNAYYRLLNCGFRLGLAAGTDYPCNGNEPPGSMLTYAKVNGHLSYNKWIDAIKKGKTVISRNGHQEFLNLRVNEMFSTGDEINAKTALDVNIDVEWTSNVPASGKVEIIINGNVVASQPASVNHGTVYKVVVKRNITESAWVCARRMGANGHETHTAPVYIRINKKPVRASSNDAKFFMSWIDNILEKISPGGAWAHYFTKDVGVVSQRYQTAREIFKKIADESDRSPLLLISSKGKFGHFSSEILKVEGLNVFSTIAPSKTAITLDNLRKKKVVILSSDVTDEQAVAVAAYVQQGGRLIITSPVRALQKLSGVKFRQENLFKHIIADSQSVLTRGTPIKPLRIHTKSSTYEVDGAHVVARFYNMSVKEAGPPAIVLHEYGKGKVMSFLYNLNENIVLTRQGNPLDAGKEMDSIPGLRAMDLFTGGWVDTSCNTLNHADEQMRIFSRGVEYMMDTFPLPKVWYFPDTLSCLVTLNNDGEDSKEHEFESQFNDVYAKGAKMTLYIKEVQFVSRAWTDKWRARGFEMSGHPDQTKFATQPGWNRMDSIYKDLNVKLKNVLDIPSMKTVTNHWFVWPGKYDTGRYDFAAQAKLEELNGIGLDCNYAHYDNNAREKKFLGSYGYTQGNYTGSGLPMKFMDALGNTIDVYQQLNNVYDQQYMEHDDKDGYFNAFKGIMDRSLYNGVYSYISVRAHNNEYFFSKAPLMRMLDYANSKHVPVWTELQLLNFIRARDDVDFRNIEFGNSALSFTVSTSRDAGAKITVMVPHSANKKRVDAILVDGQKVELNILNVKGTAYALIPITAGVSHQFSVKYK